ncbi:MAG: 3-isopropylmalate dehydratase small subunit [Verrucomicrobia bacterium]|nr:3-isopropylmalate dehydratase small subunit [Kiritimatiellia bacterium]MCO6399820.1 3-isopropylmalate dehydratase small subunit [Verrucomicrobiota bacterium]
MEPFSSHRGLVAILDRANVDTDAIIPKQFLKSIKRTGFGESLFFDWRYLPDGEPDPQFVLNFPRYQGASILVARNNFGCGSSREHAVWAVMQYGFRTIIAPRQEIGGAQVPGFADIFRNNSVKNGLLTIELEAPEVDKIFEMVERNSGLEATVDLDEQRLVLHLPEELAFHFEIDPVVKKHLRHGLDDIALSLEHEASITAFEKQHNPQMYRA